MPLENTSRVYIVLKIVQRVEMKLSFAISFEMT